MPGDVVRPSPAGVPSEGVVAPEDGVQIAAFGDSMMWGQGLRRNETFAALLLASMHDLHRKPVVMAVNRARSGAKIMARGRDRENFLDTFPELFSNRPQRQRFRDGDDGRAVELYGEVPSTFPTVRWQVDIVEPSLGEKVDIAFLSGGANDIEFDKVIDPQEFPGAFIEEFDGRISAIARDDLLDLIRRTRAKCPNAVILVFGYFAPVSEESNDHKIRAYFQHKFDSDLLWSVNQVLNIKDVDRMILEAKVRSVWAQGRAQHWIRSAVGIANESTALRGPGVLFIPSGVGPSNAIFATEPLLHQDYTDPTIDPARQERLARCPRMSHLGAIQRAWNAVRGGFNTVNLGVSISACRDLLDLIKDKGPESLVAALTEFVKSSHLKANWDRVWLALRSEGGRLQRAQIASFVHPNAAGARKYADNAFKRYRAHRDLVARIKKDERPGSPVPAPAQGESLDDLLRRYRLRGPGPLVADIGHLDVDAVSLMLVTKRASEANLSPNVALIIDTRSGPRQFRLNFPYRITVIPPTTQATGRTLFSKFHPHFEPGTTHRFTVDIDGTLELKEITGLRLVMGKDPLDGMLVAGGHGKVWRPLRCQLEINGRQVMDHVFGTEELRPGGTLTLPYPPAASDDQGAISRENAPQ